MRKSIRCVLIVGVITGALVGATPALAAFAPKIIVKPASTGGTNIRVAVGTADDPTARFALYAPIGSTATFPIAPGTPLGAVSAHAAAVDLGGAVLPLTGNVLVANPADPVILAASTACDPVTHLSILVLNLQAAGQTLNVPLFVDQASGAETAFSAIKITVCLPPPDVPVGTPGRAMFGAKLLDADFTISSLLGPTVAGQHRWRSLWTPYIPLVGKINAAATVETQSLVFQPTSLAIKVSTVGKVKKVKGKRRVTTTAIVSGSLQAGGAGAPDQRVTIVAGGKTVGTVTTKADGTFSFATKITKATVFQAKVESPDRDLGASACTATFAAQAISCIQATVAGGSLTSNTARAVPRR